MCGEGLLFASDEFHIVWSQFRSTFEDGNDATIAKALFRSIFVEVKPTFLLVIEEVDVLLRKDFLDFFLLVPEAKVAERAVDAEAIGIDF